MNAPEIAKSNQQSQSQKDFQSSNEKVHEERLKFYPN